MIDYEAAYMTWRGPLMARARNLTHVAEPEDLVQDVFCELIANGAAPDKALCYWVLHRRIIDAQRQARRRPTEILDRVELAIEPPDVDRVAAAELLATLPSKAQTVFRLSAAGYEQTEIAAALGTTKGAIKALLVRARRAAGIGCAQDGPRCTLCDQPVHAHGKCVRHYNAARYQQQRQEAAGGAP